MPTLNLKRQSSPAGSRRTVLTMLVVCGLLVATAAGCQAEGEESGQLIGKAAPDFSANSLDGKAVKLSSFKGSAVVLDFWASWCPPCRAELPILKDIYGKLKSQGLKVVAVSVDDSQSEVEAFLKKTPLPFTVLHLPKDQVGKVAKAYQIEGIPRVLYLDAKGVVKADAIGLHEKADILKDIAKLGINVKPAQ